MPGALAASTIKTTSVMGVRLVAQALTLLFIANMFGATDFGAYAGTAALAVLLGTLSNFGSNFVLLETHARGEDANRALATAVPVTMLAGTSLLVLFLLITLLFPHPLPFALLLALGVTELLIHPLITLTTLERHGLERVASSQAYLIAPLVLRCLLAIALWMAAVQDPMPVYVFGCCAIAIFWLVVATRRLRVHWPAPRRWHLPNTNEVPRMVGFGALNLTANGPTELDKTIASTILPGGVAGTYASASRIVGALTLPVISLILSAMPRLFRSEKATDAKRLLAAIFVATLAYGSLISTGVWLSAPLIDPLFGHDYEGIVPALRWLAFAIPGMTLRIAAGGGLTALGQPWARVTFELIGIGALWIAALLLAPGALQGLAFAVIASETLMAVIGWGLVLRRLTIDAKEMPVA